MFLILFYWGGSFYDQEGYGKSCSGYDCCQVLLSGIEGKGRGVLNAGDTDTEEAAWKKLVAQAKVDIMPIDDLISFAASETGAKVLGKEGAEMLLKHAQAIKAQGAEYCDCPACKGAAIVIEYENLYD